MTTYRLTDTYLVTYTVEADTLADALAAGGDLDTYDDLDFAGTEAACGWWTLCPNTATTTRRHPILGDVPICPDCAAKAARNS